MTAQLQLFMILGAVVLLLIIFAFLKRGLMSVKYSLLWLALAVGLVIAAAFPYVVYVLRDLLDIEMPVNLVFLLMFCFVLVVLLSLSIAISQLADKCKRLTQANAMGYAPTFFGVDGMDGILTAENFDASLAEGVYLLTPFSADSEDEMTQNFVAEYQDRFGEIPNQFGADAYDAIYTLYQAIQAAGATADMSNEEICDALIEVMPTLAVTGLTSAGSEMTWDENGAVSKDPTAVIIENGTYVTP